MNTPDVDHNISNASYFVIKSSSEQSVRASMRTGRWCSTYQGNKKLDQAYKDARGAVLLLFSVAGSGQFCGVAEMTSRVDYQAHSVNWENDRWKGEFSVEWRLVKNVPNS